MNPAYETDFAAWAFQQAMLLRVGKLDSLDVTNLIEEIESMGRSEHRVLDNRFTVLIGHLLKWQYQHNRQSNSWRLTIKEQRRQIHKLIATSPSLNAKLTPDWLADIWQSSLVLAINETGLDIEHFPEQPIWTIQQILDSDFFPNN